MTTANLLAGSQTSFKDDSAAQTIGIQIFYCLADASEMASGSRKYNVTVSIEIGSSKIQAAYRINKGKASTTIRGGTEGNGLQRIKLLPLRALCEDEIRALYSQTGDAIAGIKQALDSWPSEVLGYTDVRTVVRRIYEIAKATVDGSLSSEEIGDKWTWSKTVLVVPVLWTQADERSVIIQKLLEEEAEKAGIPGGTIEFESDVEAVLAVILQNRLKLLPKLNHKSRVMIADFGEQYHAFAAFEIRPESTLEVFPISRPYGDRGGIGNLWKKLCSWPVDASQALAVRNAFCKWPDVDAVDPRSGKVFPKKEVDGMFQDAFREALDNLDSEMGKVGNLQYLAVVGAAPAASVKVQSMIQDIASKHDTEVRFVHGEESRRGADNDDRTRTGSLRTDNGIDACKGAVIPWPKWIATEELQAACFGLAVQDSGNSAGNDNKRTDGHIEDIVLPSKLWGESFQFFENKFEAIQIAPEAKSVTLFPVYLSLKEESVVLPKQSKDTNREARSTTGATYMDPIKIRFNARSEGFITYRFCPGSEAERIILEVIHPRDYRRLEFVVSRERWRIVLELCEDHSLSSYDFQNSIFAIGFGGGRAFKVVWDQGVPQKSQPCWPNDKWKTWTLYRRPELPNRLRIGRGGSSWATAGFCPVFHFDAPELSRRDRLVLEMLSIKGSHSSLKLRITVLDGEPPKTLLLTINLEEAAPLPLDCWQELKEIFSKWRVRGRAAVRNDKRFDWLQVCDIPCLPLQRDSAQAVLKKVHSTSFEDDDDKQNDATSNGPPDSSRSIHHNSSLERSPSPCSSEKGCNMEPKCPGIRSTGEETPGRAYVEPERPPSPEHLPSRPPTPYCAANSGIEFSGPVSPVEEALTEDEGERLSDEIINSCLKDILQKREDTLLLNTFFYIRLCKKNGGISNQEIRKFDLFSKGYRFVVIPIFDESQKHWRIAVMCDLASAVSGGTDRALPHGNANTSQRPIVITMDSVFDEEVGVKKPLQGFLVQAAKTGPIPIEADIDLLEVRAQHLPKQDNNYDCGVYILGYMKLFFQDPDVAIKRILAKEDLGWKLDISAERSAIQDTMDKVGQ
ncbi:hypothetical protein EDB81DRAFT_769108 [Dactylonectria macrodidyma]|uniref:Ubiquitin-like protease family profile domain-containing protein n=1 Tax=Dactylonectria macrodidyma TaxID=307937 RepID=A0A9P9I7P9_9HYPO|nr:hypothetical protein EDB81DRAFT_769108 [Dactylonectria macrodidyma]